MKNAFMFPGQGSQYVGMRAPLSRFAGTAEIFSTADEVLQSPLSAVIDSGPEAELVKTSNTQPALLAMERAYSLVLEQQGYTADIVMGHSLGEYAALVYAGVIDYEQALIIVRKRGALMEDAVHAHPGKMAAVIGADRTRLEALVRECNALGVLEITNFNSPQQVVLSGQSAPLERAMAEITAGNLGRAMELNVSAPFHSSLMKPMAESFREYLSSFTFKKPRVTFIDNVTGAVEADPARIRDKLVQQLYMPVQWERSLTSASGEGAGAFIECGPGSVLAGLARRSLRGVEIKTGEKLLGS